MNSVTVYTTNTCRYCVMLKNFLNDQNIPFQEVNVQQDQRSMHKLIAATGQLGVPQTEVNGKWVVGYDPNSIMKALRD
ncbi:glutaredoxin family protein [Bacillus benzoevorans]|uniref:Glutaredoxin-like YruB-family protein n=1 Tax=Bacillus benzoevorans TaxID=1456 RepID=A0A7X0HTK1_9BACI|nr:glutaredoxin family protein [Bacillus benzoevorans]MBB6445341.1 glutaredoxin-like YruB-family protein [Bacillus benzoevorans]